MHKTNTYKYIYWHIFLVYLCVILRIPILLSGLWSVTVTFILMTVWSLIRLVGTFFQIANSITNWCKNRSWGIGFLLILFLRCNWVFRKIALCHGTTITTTEVLDGFLIQSGCVPWWSLSVVPTEYPVNGIQRMWSSGSGLPLTGHTGAPSVL